MTTLLTEWCNIFGAESGGGRLLGGLSSSKPKVQWYCPTRAVVHARMTCRHGHHGQMMGVCGKHFREFEKAVTFCPRCNQDPPGHKCRLVLESIS